MKLLRILAFSSIPTLSLSLSLIISFILLPIISDALAATYYVDATTGEDTHSGLSIADAWKTIVKVNSSKFLPGDQILFRRGKLWREQLIIPSSGSAGNHIIFGAYGSGNPPIFMASASKSSIRDWKNETGSLWYTSTDSFPTDVGSIMVNGTTVLTGKKLVKGRLGTQGDFFYDSTNHRVYLHSSDNPATQYPSGIECWYAGTAASWGNIIFINAKNYIDIQDIVLKYGGGYGLKAYNVDHVNIRRLTVSYVGGSIVGSELREGGGIEIQGLSSNTLVEYCTISHVFDEGLSSQNGQNGVFSNQIFQYNTVDYCGCGAAFAPWVTVKATVSNIVFQYNTITNSGLGWSPPGITNMGGQGFYVRAYPGMARGLIKGNTITNNASGAFPNGIGILIYNQDGGEAELDIIGNNITGYHNQGIRVYGNIKSKIAYNIVYGIAATAGQGLFAAINTSPVNIYNNVFVKTNTGDVYLVQIGEVGHAATKVNFKNNILYDTGTNWGALLRKAKGSTITADYNSYYLAKGTWVEWNGTAYYNLADFKTAARQDAHSLGSDPKFVSTSAPNFHLKISSPAINAGTNVGLVSDYDGDSVPQGSAPNIGAYEYRPNLSFPPPK